jgi:hypothetical protein
VVVKSVPDFSTEWPIKFLSESITATFVLDAPTSAPTKTGCGYSFLLMDDRSSLKK